MQYERGDIITYYRYHSAERAYVINCGDSAVSVQHITEDGYRVPGAFTVYLVEIIPVQDII